MSQQQLPDLQNQADVRGITLDRVGVTNIKFPIRVFTDVRGNSGHSDTPPTREVSATVELFVSVPAEFKGANLSRFMRTLNAFEYNGMSVAQLNDLLEALRKSLDSPDAYARFEFDYYVDRPAPVSKLSAPQAYRCAFTGILKGDAPLVFINEVHVIAASLCPCSRGMSLLEQLNVASDLRTDMSPEAEAALKKSPMAKLVGMGAHNQRSRITAKVITKGNETLWLEDLIALTEAAASAPVFPILKREDEKFVTELAYNNAKFSEDITRDLQGSLEAHPLVESWSIRVTNEESIHPYDVTCTQQSKNWKY